jgi:hypothetical protein
MNWDTTPEVNEVEVEGTNGPVIIVNGSVIPLTVGDNFVTAVKDVARSANFGKFRLFMNDSEISPAEAPTSITSEMKIELRPYDVAG